MGKRLPVLYPYEKICMFCIQYKCKCKGVFTASILRVASLGF